MGRPNNVIGGALYDLLKVGVDLSVYRIYDKWSKTLSEKQAWQETLLEIGKVQFGSTTSRPYKFLRHFIYGKGAPITIDLIDLFNQDKSVKDRVISETYRRVLKINTVAETRQQAISTSMFPNGIDPVITIAQKNFSNEDWKNSLGTYDLKITQYFEINPELCGVTLVSNNPYQWHPEDDRFTQAIHMVGAALVKMNGAANFTMPARTSTIFIDKKYAEAIRFSTLKQNFPNNGKFPVDFDVLGRLAGALW